MNLYAQSVVWFLASWLVSQPLALAQQQPGQQQEQPAATFPNPGTPRDGYIFLVVKVFNANEPASPGALRPSRALVFYRNQQTQGPELLPDATFSAIEGSNRFYKVEVPANILIDQVVIEVSSGSTNFNPAVITKVVTKQLMVIYPGASRPDEPQWNFHVWMGQMSTYQTILSQLLDEPLQISREDLLKAMQARFGKQLKMTAYAVRNGKVVGAKNKPLTAEQKKAAEELATKVLDLYGIEKAPTKKAAPYPPRYYCQPYCPPRCTWRRCR